MAPETYNYKNDPRGPGLAVHYNPNEKITVTVQDYDTQGRPDPRLRYQLPSNDPDAWNMAWRGPYVPTARKTRELKEREAAARREQLAAQRAAAAAVHPEPELEAQVDVPNKNSIIAGAVLVLILLLFLGSVVQLKDGSRSPWKVTDSEWVAWFWGMVAYLQGIWVWATSWPSRTATPVGEEHDGNVG